MKSIPTLLKITPNRHENLLFEVYFIWCNSLAINDHSDFQKLMANKAINRFFLNEYAKLEHDFIDLINVYKNNPEIDHKDLFKLYTECTIKIHDRYPLPLIKAARKTNIL